MEHNHIRAWRIHRGMRQIDLAKAIGVSRSYVAQVELGNRRYDQLFLEPAALALGCTPADLIGHPPGQTESIDRLLNNLPDELRERVEAAVRAMIQTKD